MKSVKHICLLTLLALTSCFTDSDDALQNNLQAYILNKPTAIGAVIACAASDKDTNAVLTFYYPETGASNIRFFETETAQVDKNDFTKYKQIPLQSTPFFNGYLGKFTQDSANEKWIIITFELDGEIKISNPIRTKQNTKPTIWTDAVTIDQTQSSMPKFIWEDDAVGDNAIYFQVISDAKNNLLSGTYTYNNQFQYYNTANVVLNITTQTPPTLAVGNDYNFTLMDVSEDNWVNLVVLKTFIAE